MRTNIIFSLLFVVFFVIGCSDSSSYGSPESGNGETEDQALVSVSGQVVQGYGSDSSSMTSTIMSSEGTSDETFIDNCRDEYQILWNGLEPNKEVNGEQFNITREYQGETFIAQNIDVNNNLQADVNIIATNVPGMPFIDHINFDVTCDGNPDLNIDTTGNGLPDRNIDENKDGTPDYSITPVDVFTVPDATVELIPIDNGTNPGAAIMEDRVTAVSDNNGNFSIDGIRTGDYKLIVRKDNNGVVAWSRRMINVTTEDQDFGQFPLTTSPYIHQLISDDIDFDEVSFNARSIGLSSTETTFNENNVYEFTVDIIDPNDDGVYMYLPRHFQNDNGEWEISFDRVAGELIDTNAGGDSIFRFNISIVLRNNYYEYQINKEIFEKVPRYIRGEVNLNYGCQSGNFLEDCDTQPVFGWNEIEAMVVSAAFANSDGINALGNENVDAFVQFSLDNSNFDFDPFSEDINIYEATVNGQTYINSSPSEDFGADIGDISGINYIEVTVDVENNSNFDSRVFWRVPADDLSSVEYIGDDTMRVSVDNIQKTYQPRDFSVYAYHIDESGRKSTETTKFTITYDVAGDAQPSQCDNMVINGNTGNDHPIYYPGDTLNIEAMVSDPNGLPTEYWIVTDSGTDVTNGYISSTKTSQYTIRSNDARDSFMLIMRCKNNDGFGQIGTDSRDDIYYQSVPISAH